MTNTRMLQDPGYDGILFHYLVACKQALQCSLSAGQEMEKSLQPCLWNLNSPVAPCQLSCQISVVQCEAKVSVNVKKKHWKTQTKGDDIISQGSPEGLLAGNF